MATSTVTSKGQITIPKAVRERLHLEAGDKIDFRVDPDGTIRMHPIAKRVDDVFGAFAYKASCPRSPTAIKRRVAEEFKKQRP